jgi:AcrR family transcriptional regulator
MVDMRAKLLNVAAELFAERGYEAVSMRDIAKVVGVTQANLYYHFRDKADLIEATLTSVFDARAAELEVWLAGRPGNQIEAFIRWFIRALMADQIFARLLHRELIDGDDNRIAMLCRTVLQKPFRFLVAAVEGRTKREAAEKIALSLVGFVLGQVLVLPLAPGLTGHEGKAELPDVVATRLLGLIQPIAVEV